MWRVRALAAVAMMLTACGETRHRGTASPSSGETSTRDAIATAPRRGLATGASVSSTSTAIVALAALAAGDGPGRLATYPLVYRLPSDFSTSYGHYQLFFRTRGSFLGFDRSGESRAGRVRLEDSYNGEDGFGGLNAKRCWTWQVGDTERLDRKRIGDKVRVRFDLRRTGPESRTVTLREAPSGLADLPYIWFRHPAVKLRLSWIGCNI